MYASTFYKIYQKTFDFLPGALFEEITLHIEVVWGDWHIEYVDVSEEHPGTKTRGFKAGDWLFDQMVREIYNDSAMMDDIGYHSRIAYLEGAY